MRKVAFLIPASPTRSFLAQIAAFNFALYSLTWARWQPNLMVCMGGEPDSDALNQWQPHLRDVAMVFVPRSQWESTAFFCAQIDGPFRWAPHDADVLVRMDADTLPVIDNTVLMPDGSSFSLGQIAPGLSDTPIMQFYRKNALDGDWTNYWGPNIACLKAMLEENNFEVVSAQLVDSRAILRSKITEDDKLTRAVNAAYAVRMGNLFSGSDRENR